MKNKIITIAAMLCVALTAHADLIGTGKTVTMDGGDSDWNYTTDLLYGAGEITAGAPAASSYDNIMMANDGTKLYFGLDTSGEYGASVWNTWTRNIYIDRDIDGATGFDGAWMTHGYDYLIQYGNSGLSYSIFSFGGGANQAAWSWNFVSEITYAYTEASDFLEMSVDLSSLGLSADDQFKATFNTTGTGIDTETWAYAWESGAETYTVAAVPEPATIGMLGMGTLIMLLIRRMKA